MKHILTIIIALAVGFFAGREHLKYEMRSTIAKAVEGFGEGVKKSFGRGSENTTPSTTGQAQERTAAPTTQQAKANEKKRLEQNAKLENALEVRLLNKAFQEANYGDKRFQDQLVLTLLFKNKSEKDISGFRGVAVFKDMFGERIKSVRLSHDATIPAYQEMKWDGTVHYNQFMHEDIALRGADSSKIKFAFEPQTVIYADGETISLDSKED